MTQPESLEYSDYDYPTDPITEFSTHGEQVPISSYGNRTSSTVFDFRNQKQYSVPSFNTRVKKVSCGDSFFIILTEDGSVYHKKLTGQGYTKRNEGKYVQDIGCGHTIFAMQTSNLFFVYLTIRSQ